MLKKLIVHALSRSMGTKVPWKRNGFRQTVAPEFEMTNIESLIMVTWWSTRWRRDAANQNPYPLAAAATGHCKMIIMGCAKLEYTSAANSALDQGRYGGAELVDA
ncbi:hypothetical protein DL768_002842 [Monosporascus sp. mg162]|nr:hypothetical protein DL768_002842 [Monosporascus sp. mg162]